MTCRGFRSTALVFSVVSSLLVPTSGWAQNFDMGGLAGGLIGGAIAGAMMQNAQSRRVVVYRTVHQYRRAAYRPASRHYSRRAPSTHAGTAVVDRGADPFAARASATVLPAAAKP